MPYLIVGYMFLFIFRPFEVWSQLGDLHIERIYMIITLLFFIFSQKNRVILGALHYFFVALFLMVWLAPYYTNYPELTEWQSSEYFKYFVFYIVLLFGIRTQKELEFILLGFLGVMFIYEAKSAWEFFINGRHMYRMGIVRMIGIDEAFNDPNTYAASVCYTLPIMGLFWRYQYAHYPKWIIWSILLGLAGTTILSIIFTGSRSGQITLLLFLVFMIMRSQRRIALILLGIVALNLAWTYMPLQYKSRFESIWNPSVTDKTAEESAEGRIEGIKDGYHMLFNHPFLGYGAGTFSMAREEVGSTVVGLQAHNLYGQLMGEMGLTGILIFFGICVQLWRDSRQLIAKARELPPERGQFYILLGYSVLETLVLLLFQGNFGHNLYRHTWLWIAAFIMLGNYCIQQKQEIEEATPALTIS